VLRDHLTSSSDLLGQCVLKNIIQPKLSVRCFIAAEVSADAKEKIAEIMRPADHGGLRAVGKELLHITIKFLGDLDEKEADNCWNAVDSCAGAKIPVKLSGGGAFPNPHKARVIFVNAVSPELTQLAKCIFAGTMAYGDGKEFLGHLTVARVRGRPVDATGLIEKLGAIQSEETIGKITLKKSTLTPTGPVYEDIYVKNLE
jgi:2'-5' RNA ligase